MLIYIRTFGYLFSEFDILINTVYNEFRAFTISSPYSDIKYVMYHSFLKEYL